MSACRCGNRGRHGDCAAKSPAKFCFGAAGSLQQARYALADGGLFGVGLGQSNSKWSYLPQAYNDFIFAIIGEELGVIGALAVIALFAGVVYFGLRVSARSVDPFLRIAASVATTWIAMQAVINFAYVVGLVPVTGLQLPLVSAGGTSMITTLIMFGLLLHAAYREPPALVSHRNAANLRWLHRTFGKPEVSRLSVETLRCVPGPRP